MWTYCVKAQVAELVDAIDSKSIDGNIMRVRFSPWAHLYMETLIQIIGWIGTILILLAYYFVSSKKVDADSKIYQLMNLFGVIGVGINVLHQKAWPSVALQIVWGLIAIYSLIKNNNK